MLHAGSNDPASLSKQQTPTDKRKLKKLKYRYTEIRVCRYSTNNSTSHESTRHTYVHYHAYSHAHTVHTVCMNRRPHVHGCARERKTYSSLHAGTHNNIMYTQSLLYECIDTLLGHCISKSKRTPYKHTP